MKISLIAAKADNNVIGFNNEMPWYAEGEQLLFKAMTFNQWILVGRKTFESMGLLPNRKYAVVSRNSSSIEENEQVKLFNSIGSAIDGMKKVTDHLFIAGGGEIYSETIHLADVIHLSNVHASPEGDTYFPDIPVHFKVVFNQSFKSNIDYDYTILIK